MKRFLLLLAASIALPAFADQFSDWDKNSDGKLTKDELPEGPRNNFEKVDRNGDGAISREEHAEFLKRRQQQGGQQQAPKIPDDVEVIADIHYASTTNKKQTLDLILPKKREGKLPSIVFIHGGAWMAGDKKSGHGNVMNYVRSGNYVGASVEYRFSQEATWPAQIHDCKAAIRWLRGNAAKYNIDPDRIAVWGGSAGGHLVAMLGTSGDVKDLEGDLGEFDKESSQVQAVIDFFGPSDFRTITNSPSTLRHGDADSPESKLIGGRIGDNPEKAKHVSPVVYATKDDPPFLIAHGTKDMTVPFSQSEEMAKALVDAKVATPPVFIPMTDAGHGFRSDELNKRIGQFLDLHLRGVKSEISSAAIAP
jgi:acetyl esterase/lipase